MVTRRFVLGALGLSTPVLARSNSTGSVGVALSKTPPRPLPIAMGTSRWTPASWTNLEIVGR